MTLLLLLACQKTEAPALAPETHTWKEEGELVVQGLEEVEALHKAGNRQAARVLAERVYTERWEPRLEQAARRMDATANGPVIETEYAFAVLMLELDGNGRDLEAKVHTLQEKTRAIAEAAARRALSLAAAAASSACSARALIEACLSLGHASEELPRPS
jgi:hypothetical protein